MGTWTRTWLPPAHVSDIHGTKQQRIQCPAQWSLNQSRCLEIPRFKSPQPSTAPERCTHSRTPPRQATLYLHTKATWRSHLFFPQRLRNVFLKAAQLSSLTFEPTQADTCIPSTASPGPAVEGPGVRAAGLNRSRSSSAHAKHSDTDKMLVLITLPVRAAHDLVRYTCHAAELTLSITVTISELTGPTEVWFWETSASLPFLSHVLYINTQLVASAMFLRDVVNHLLNGFDSSPPHCSLQISNAPRPFFDARMSCDVMHSSFQEIHSGKSLWRHFGEFLRGFWSCPVS